MKCYEKSCFVNQNKSSLFRSFGKPHVPSRSMGTTLSWRLGMPVGTCMCGMLRRSPLQQQPPPRFTSSPLIRCVSSSFFCSHVLLRECFCFFFCSFVYFYDPELTDPTLGHQRAAILSAAKILSRRGQRRWKCVHL